MLLRLYVLGLVGLAAVSVLAADPALPPKLSLLIVDGMNNHDWPRATRILKEPLANSGRFMVDVSTSPAADAPKEAWDQWRPEFAKYDVVLSNFNGGHKPTSQHWPEKVEKSLEDYVSARAEITYTTHPTLSPSPQVALAKTCTVYFCASP